MNRLKQAKTSHRRTALSAALYSAGIFGALAAVPNAYAIPMFGLALNGTQIVAFDSTAPGTITATRNLTGFLAASEGLFAIDFRPANGMLYGISQLGHIYTINTATGLLTVARNNGGTDFIDDTAFYGFDFNPAADRLRLTNTLPVPTNRNINVDDPTPAAFAAGQTDLAYATGDSGAGMTPNVEASAYTNSFSGTAPATTVLYGIDTSRDVLVIQNPPASGSLTTVGTTGLGVTFENLTGFDIAGDGTGTGAGGINTAFAVSGAPFGTDTPATLYTINLTTGAATAVGPIGAATPVTPGGTRIVDIAAAIQAPPAGGGGAVQFSATTLTVAENVGNAVLTVTRPAGSTGAVTVIATPTNGTGAAGAVAPGDFTATPITVSFAAADLSRPVNVPIIDDTAQEGNETFTVVLSAPTGGATLGASTATVTISANDAPTPPPPPPPAPAPTDDDDGGCTVNANGKDAGLLILLLGGALAALRRRMKR